MLTNFTLRLLYLFPEQHPNRFNCSIASRLKRTRLCPFPGLVPEMISWLLQSAGITNYQVTVYSSAQSPYTTGPALVHNGTADVAILRLTPTEPRLKLFTPSMPIPGLEDTMHWALSMTLTRMSGTRHWVWSRFAGSQLLLLQDLLFPESILNSRSLIFVPNCKKRFEQVFHWKTWLVLFLVLSAIKSLTAAQYCLRLRSFQYYLTYLATLLTLISSLYQNFLLINLVSPNVNYQFKNVHELGALIQSRQVTAISFPGISWMSYLDLRRLRPLKMALKANPLVFVHSDLDLKRYESSIREGRMVYIGTHMESVALNWCGTRVVRLKDIPTERNGLLYNKQTPEDIIRRIDNAIFHSDQILLGIQRRYQLYLNHKTMNCVNSVTGNNSTQIGRLKSGNKNAFRMVELSGAFIALVVGLVIGVGFMIGEALKHHTKISMWGNEEFSMF